jgi:hypothetical protein
MTDSRHTGPPMTLGNMRQHGVTTLIARCTGRDDNGVGCNHDSVVDVSKLPDGIEVPSIGRHMRCGRCGHLGADARPNWAQAQRSSAPRKEA